MKKLKPLDICVYDKEDFKRYLEKEISGTLGVSIECYYSFLFDCTKQGIIVTNDYLKDNIKSYERKYKIGKVLKNGTKIKP